MIFSFWKRRLLAKQTAELLSIATAQVRESITKWVPVDRVVGCKHCGQRMLAWPRSAATCASIEPMTRRPSLPLPGLSMSCA